MKKNKNKYFIVITLIVIFYIYGYLNSIDITFFPIDYSFNEVYLGMTKSDFLAVKPNTRESDSENNLFIEDYNVNNIGLGYTYFYFSFLYNKLDHISQKINYDDSNLAKLKTKDILINLEKIKNLSKNIIF